MKTQIILSKMSIWILMLLLLIQSNFCFDENLYKSKCKNDSDCAPPNLICSIDKICTRAPVFPIHRNVI